MLIKDFKLIDKDIYKIEIIQEISNDHMISLFNIIQSLNIYYDTVKNLVLIPNTMKKIKIDFDFDKKNIKKSLHKIVDKIKPSLAIAFTILTLTTNSLNATDIQFNDGFIEKTTIQKEIPETDTIKYKDSIDSIVNESINEFVEHFKSHLSTTNIADIKKSINIIVDKNLSISDTYALNDSKSDNNIPEKFLNQRNNNVKEYNNELSLRVNNKIVGNLKIFININTQLLEKYQNTDDEKYKLAIKNFYKNLLFHELSHAYYIMPDTNETANEFFAVNNQIFDIQNTKFEKEFIINSNGSYLKSEEYLPILKFNVNDDLDFKLYESQFSDPFEPDEEPKEENTKEIADIEFLRKLIIDSIDKLDPINNLLLIIGSNKRIEFSQRDNMIYGEYFSVINNGKFFSKEDFKLYPDLTHLTDEVKMEIYFSKEINGGFFKLMKNILKKYNLKLDKQQKNIILDLITHNILIQQFPFHKISPSEKEILSTVISNKLITILSKDNIDFFDHSDTDMEIL